MLLLHGFGGNCDHWRKNLPVLGLKCRAYAIDLLGYGFSSKPSPRCAVLAGRHEGHATCRAAHRTTSCLLSCRDAGVNKLYCFETWARQSLDFLDAFVGEPAFIICNSVGGVPADPSRVFLPSSGSCPDQRACCAGIAGLQAAVDAPEKVRGVQLLDVSLRMLHTSKQAPWQRPLVSAFQRLLRTTQLGAWFFKAIAKPQVGWLCAAQAP